MTAPTQSNTGHTRDATGASSHYRLDIQGLRAVAVALVVAYHAGVLLPGGFVGVDVFFVVSGYVITQVLVRELDATGTIDFGRFYLRRVRRLLPALATMLAVTVVASILLAPLVAHGDTHGTAVAASLFNANNHLITNGEAGYFDAGAETNPLLHTWSLAVEEQFYFIFPGLLAGVWALARRRGTDPRRALLGALSAVSVVSFFASWLLTSGRWDLWGRGPVVAFYSVPTRTWEFAAGAALAIWGTRLRRRAGPVAVVVGVALLGWASLGFDEATAFPGMAALVPVAATSLLIAGDWRPARLALSWQPLARLGDLSYAWYLWHWPAIVMARAMWPEHNTTAAVGAALLSLFPAKWSYRLVEQRFRRGATRPARATLRLALTAIVVPLAATVALASASAAIESSEAVAPFDFHIDRTQGCRDWHGIGPTDRCYWPTDGSSGLAVLVGDSNAGHFAEGFVEGAAAAGLDASIQTRSGCPFLDADVIDHKLGLRIDCSEFRDAALAELLEVRPEVVALSVASDDYIANDRFELSRGGTVARSPDEKSAMWEAGLRPILTMLDNAGIGVVLVQPVPKPEPGWEPTEMAPLRLVGPDRWASGDRSAVDAEQQRELATIAELDAADGVATVEDFFFDLCPHDPCRTKDDRGWLYRDDQHISINASQLLAPRWKEILTTASSQ